MIADLALPPEQIADFCERHHIRKLALFGSVLQPDARADSDVDVLVEFEPGHVPGFDLIRIQDELVTLFGGRAVDLITPKFLNEHIREQVLVEARVIYAQG